MNNQTVIGVFDTKSQARSAKKALADAGFNNDVIDVSSYGEHGKRYDDYDKHESNVGGFFDNLFGNDDKANNRDRDYNRAGREVASRGTVVTVHTKNMDRAKEAAAILDRYGAIDMEDRHKQYENKTFDADTNRKNLNERYGNVDSDGVIEVVKEDVSVGKRQVETGGVTVRSHIVERPVEETVRLRREEAFVERTPVDRPAERGDFNDETITVKETSEEAVVGKDARVVEEVKVGKKVDERTETIHETARETEVDVVKDGDRRTNDRNDKNIRR